MKRLFLVLVVMGFAVFNSVSALGSENFRQRMHTKLWMQRTEEDTKAEILFGREVAARILGMYGLYGNNRVLRYVNLVGDAVAVFSGRSDIDFKFAVLDTDSINAYSAPGGYVFVTKGAIEVMDDEAELAAVLAHEIGHVVNMDIVRELGIKAKGGVSAGFAKIMGGTRESIGVAMKQLVDKAIQILFETGYKREDEFKADQTAVVLLALSGYDPTAIIRYLKKVSKISGSKTEILDKTHPPFEERIKRIEIFIKENGIATDKGVKMKERFRKECLKYVR